MSATFKNSKKKLLQSEFRKCMTERNKRKNVKLVESPLAKYNDQGQLTCVLCKTIVKSETVWTVHINGKIHQQNVEKVKNLKASTNNFTTPLKRSSSAAPDTEIPEKKIKGILKNASTQNVSTTKTIENKLPDDFFDAKGTNNVSDSVEVKDKIKDDVMETEDLSERKDTLPEGFFDDPKLDAKARNQEYKDPKEEEWERFLKIIKEADTESNAIIAEDQEEATTERQIDEIDEQIKKLSRVLDLEKKKVKVIATPIERKVTNSSEKEEELEENFDEFLDWRTKKSFM